MLIDHGRVDTPTAASTGADSPMLGQHYKAHRWRKLFEFDAAPILSTSETRAELTAFSKRNCFPVCAGVAFSPAPPPQVPPPPRVPNF